jgi:hypothetical protein
VLLSLDESPSTGDSDFSVVGKESVCCRVGILIHIGKESRDECLHAVVQGTISVLNNKTTNAGQMSIKSKYTKIKSVSLEIKDERDLEIRRSDNPITAIRSVR